MQPNPVPKPAINIALTERFELIRELFLEHSGTRPVSALKRLMELLIDDIRKQNDVVLPDDLKHNQGKIAILQQLHDYLTKGVPTPRQD